MCGVVGEKGNQVDTVLPSERVSSFSINVVCPNNDDDERKDDIETIKHRKVLEGEV